LTGLGAEAGLWDIVMGAGLMVKFVLLVLLLFSIVSWAIIAYKIVLLKKIEKESERFYNMFWEKRQFSQIYSESRAFKYTPFKGLFTALYNEFSASGRYSEDAPQKALQREDLERAERVLKKTGALEMARLEHAVSFLATTGNAAPFIGLFGTVWGIMTAFRDIGAKGAANLATVAPGISEALIATAMGLIAAIPATVAYNYIISKIDRAAGDISNFSADLLNIIHKEVGKQR
jgi:biopolymer transport protein TolQ